MGELEVDPHLVDEKERLANRDEWVNLTIVNRDKAGADVIGDKATALGPLAPYTGLLWKIINRTRVK